MIERPLQLVCHRKTFEWFAHYDHALLSIDTFYLGFKSKEYQIITEKDDELSRLKIFRS